MIGADFSDAADVARAVRSSLAELRGDDAEAAVRQFLKDHPDHSDGHRLSGEVCRSLWRLSEARASFERAIALDPANAEARAGLGFVQIVSNEVEKGAENCRWAIQLRSDLAAPHRYLATALIIASRFAEAAEQALEARRLAPLQLENSITLAAAWFRCGLRPGATRLINRVIDSDSRWAEAWTTRAAFRMGEGDLAGASDDLGHALTLKPWLPPAHALMARIHAAKGQMDAAFDAIRRARERNPAALEYLLLEAGWLAANEERDTALALCEGEWWRHPRSRELKTRIAMWRLEEGRTDDARKLVSGVPAGAPPDVLWQRLGDIWIEIGADCGGNALACYLRAFETRPDPLLRVSIADLFGRFGQPRQGLTYLDGLDSANAAALGADLLFSAQESDAALDRLRVAADRYPHDAHVALRLGMLLRAAGTATDAEAHLRRAVALAPKDPMASEQLGIVLSDLERFDEARTCLQQAVEVSGGTPAVRFNLAILLARQRRWGDAEAAFRQVMQGDPLNMDALTKLASVVAEQKRLPEAVEMLDVVIERTPHDEIARDLLIRAYRSMHRVDAAVEAAKRWVEDVPDAFAPLAALARQLAAARHPDAEATADRAWALSPESMPAIEMRADVESQLGRYERAVEWLDRGLAMVPEHLGLLTHRGVIAPEFAAPGAGEEALRRVLALAPDASQAPVNLALLALRLGAFEEGWRLYESRDTAMRDTKALLVARERAGGTIDLSEASVLVRAEQGLGDTLQFMRYVPRLAREAREVIFHVPDPITWMARDLAPNVRVFGYQEPVPEVDYQTALMSLPRYYGTDIRSIPADVPYIVADPNLRARWRQRIGDDGFKIGIAWQTDPAHGNARRWIPLRHLAPLAELPGVRLISLQKFHGLDQIAQLPAHQRIETLVDRFDEGPDGFSDTAAILTHLDLVISIDTSIAHLGGAMARPTWVLLQRANDWRWLTDRQDNPWYPTARIFRQRVADDWADVGRRVRERCAAVLAGLPAVWPV